MTSFTLKAWAVLAFPLALVGELWGVPAAEALDPLVGLPAGLRIEAEVCELCLDADEPPMVATKPVMPIPRIRPAIAAATLRAVSSEELRIACPSQSAVSQVGMGESRAIVKAVKT